VHGDSMKISGKAFEHYLVRRYYEQTKRVVGTDSLNRACRLIEAQAEKQAQHTLYNRVATGCDGAVWIDLGDEDRSSIKVDSEGWHLKKDVPILFRRYSHQRALTQPAHGGNFQLLFSYLNLANDDQRMLLTA